MDPDGPDSPHSSDDIDLALAALMKGLPEIATNELETLLSLLNDLPMHEPEEKDGISVKEALEVSTHITCCVLCYITWYGFAAGRFCQR